MLSSIDKEKTVKPEEQTAMLRQYVMGFMISYIEKHFDEFYEIPEWDKITDIKIIDIKQMDINVKNQIMYRIIYLLLAGKSPETIKKELTATAKDNKNEGSMEEMVKKAKDGQLSRDISSMVARTDSVIDDKMIPKENIIPIDIYNDINILLEDSLVPIATNKLQGMDLIKVAKSIAKKA